MKQEKTPTLPVHVVILREELTRRIRANRSYSLRSFARQLGMDASLLSKTLQNRRTLSPTNAVKILERSQLSTGEKNLFWQSYLQTRQKGQAHYNLDTHATSSPIEDREKPLTHDLFKLIAEPHHYGIVELTRVKSFQNNSQWIGNTLGLPSEVVDASVERLLKVGILKKDGEKIVRSPGRHTTQDKSVTDPALKYHQRKVIEQSAIALDRVPIERRNQTSMTIAINPEKIPLAKKMMQDFMNQLSDVLEAGPLEEVYQMSFSLFPISPLQPKEEPHAE